MQKSLRLQARDNTGFPGFSCQGRYRLGVRTSGSQPENPGSIPGTATKFPRPQAGPKSTLANSKKGHRSVLHRGVRNQLKNRSRALVHDGDGFFHVMVRFLDVLQDA
jgi:hypothetical protein